MNVPARPPGLPPTRARAGTRGPAMPYTPVFEDPSLDHQIRFRQYRGLYLRLTCNCDKTIGIRRSWTVPEAMAEWRKHLPPAAAATFPDAAVATQPTQEG